MTCTTLARSEPLDGLPPLLRLALAYAPARSRSDLATFFALDARLAGIVRAAREPMLAQLRLAWWREQLAGAPQGPGLADPLLAALAEWPGPRQSLAGLAEGWEAMTGAAPLPSSAFAALAEARATALAGLAGSEAARAEALRTGRNWALYDIAGHLGDPRERAAALELARAQDWRAARLPRSLRPLAVLHGLAARTIWHDSPAAGPTPRAALVAVRIGLFGR